MAVFKNLNASKVHTLTLIYAAFVAGVCSIIYELLIATTVSYFLGDSVKYFSITIGLYMASMGLGSYWSKFIVDDVLRKFVIAECFLALVGGISIPALYFAYAYTDAFLIFYILFLVTIGFIIGLEIPFITRLMQEYHQLRVNIANILSFDYLGALIATVSFPFILLPLFGVYQSSLIFGLINISISFVMLWIFADKLSDSRRGLRIFAILVTLGLGLMIIYSTSALKHWDNYLYRDRVIYSQQSPYQKIVLTKGKEDVRLFLDGNLQFSSIDEHRYHEVLVHVPFSIQKRPSIKRVLLLGAGDGLAVRELLKYDTIEEIVLVDLDPEVIRLAQENSHITAINNHSLSSAKVKIVIEDAFVFLQNNEIPFDFVICDLPDPNNLSLSRLYSKQFYSLVRMNLREGGGIVTQATSPYFAKDVFWSIVKTIEAAEFGYVYPYYVQVPSFGDWGFIMAFDAQRNIENPDIAVETEFLDDQNFSSLFIFSKDMKSDNMIINHIDRSELLSRYLESWRYYAY